MPLFTLTAGVAATVIFTVYSCVSCCVSSCYQDDDDRQHRHSYQPSSTCYGSITTQPAYRPLPSPTNTRDSPVRSKPTVKTPPIPDLDRGSYYPAQNRISQRAGPSCPPVVRLLSAARIVRDPQHSSAPRRLTPALQSTSSVDPQPRTRPGERESILRRPPLTSLPDLSNLESDGSRSVRESTTAEDLRERARLKKQEMQKANKLAVRARKAGNNAAKDRHNRDVLAHKNAMTELNKAAAKIIFKEKNKDRAEGTVDLHGLFVKEALEYAKQEFQSAALRTDRVVRFIVGKGLHSEAGKAKIRPALEQLCDERGYKHYLHPRNAGVLVVQC